MKLNEVKTETASKLKVNVSELDYITNELIESYEDAIEENEKDEIQIDGEVGILAGVYCNSLTYDSGTGGYIRYKRGEKGTPNYGCGNNPYKLSKTGTTVREIGSCSGGRKQYLVTW